MTITVPSQSDPSATYEVDLDAGSCTCPHFARIAPKECKHFAQARKLAEKQVSAPDPIRRNADPPDLEELPGPAPAPTLAAQDEEFWAELMKPDPDPERLPAVVADNRLAEETAGHLVRAILKAETAVGDLERRARLDALAWKSMIDTAQAKADGWRAMILDFMQRSGITKLQSPWWTVYPIRGRRRVEILDEAACIAACKQQYPKAVKVVEMLDAKEFAVAFDSLPKVFGEHEGELGAKVPAIAEEKFGEPSLGIRKK